MPPVTVTIEMFDAIISVYVNADSMVSISVNGRWAGEGRWDGAIVDCAAHFGNDVQTDVVYNALDEKIQDAIDAQ